MKRFARYGILALVALACALLAHVAPHFVPVAFAAGMYAEVAQEQWLGEPTEGDFNMGEGISTSQYQNPNTSITQQRSVASGPPWSQSILTFLIIVGILILLKVLMEHNHKAEFASTRIGLETWLVNGLLVALFFYATKTTIGPNGAIHGVPAPIQQFFGAI